MKILDRLFRFEVLERVLSQESLLEQMLRFEAHLAMAEAAAGVIPENAAVQIARCCTLNVLDMDALAEGAAADGNVAISLVRQLTCAVAAVDPEAAAYVHWGATSQDVIDTAAVIQMRDAARVIIGEVRRLCGTLKNLTVKHRFTVMAGRTWLQHAIPTTFGFKTAQMLDAVMTMQARLVEHNRTYSLLQFGGAAGTLAAFATGGGMVAADLARGLDLRNPKVSWHANRIPFAELAVSLGLLSGTLSKIAHDVVLLSQTEVAELAEGGSSRGGSSTMPQKRNPVTATAILSNCLRVPGLVATMLTAMPQEHERGLGNWHSEWETLPELVSLVGAAAHHAANLMEHLQVYPERMRQNLEITHGLIYSEAVAFRLAGKIGKAAAHELLKTATVGAQESHKDLADVLASDPRITKHVNGDELKRLFDPQQYLGSTQEVIDAILSCYASQPTYAPC
jgi:3-carboxy-cis,cis-muconate cycloisomerase